MYLSYHAHVKVHALFTEAAHQSDINAMDFVYLFVSSKVNYCQASKGEGLFSFAKA